MSAHDKARNEIDEKTGKVKAWVGDRTDNPDLAAKGRSKQTSAKTRQAGEHVKGAARDVGDHVRDAAEDVKDAARPKGRAR